ncbi:hypothetical protein BconGalA64_42990 [Burkholderia contaminans]|nr:hypothetical protein BconGalA64_42990 [Burkholderia contaminans]
MRPPGDRARRTAQLSRSRTGTARRRERPAGPPRCIKMAADDSIARTLPMASNLHDLPDSPCIGVCSTLFDEVCKGCGRTAAEVSNWVFLSDDEKRAVWERITREGTAMRFQYDKL